jgi:hypothetical protein
MLCKPVPLPRDNGTSPGVLTENTNPTIHKMRIHLFIATLIVPVLSTVAQAEPSFEDDLQPFLSKHCLRCHNEELQEGEFRIDILSRDIGIRDTPQWAEVMERINSGEMPPEDEKVRPTAEQGAEIVEWIAARIREGEAARMAQRDRVTYNRLTREEYVNTVRDLIGVHYDAEDPGGLLEDRFRPRTSRSTSPPPRSFSMKLILIRRSRILKHRRQPSSSGPTDRITMRLLKPGCSTNFATN